MKESGKNERGYSDQACPSRTTWWLLFDERLEHDQQTALVVHRRTCKACQRTWREIEQLAGALSKARPSGAWTEKIGTVAFRRYRRRRILRRTAGACALAAVVVGAALLALAPERNNDRSGKAAAPTVASTGKVTVPPKEVRIPQGSAQKERTGSEVPGENEEENLPPRSEISLACGAHYHQSSDCRLSVLENTPKRCLIELRAGWARFSVPHPVERFVVATPAVTVLVHGTVFTVLHEPEQQRSEVRVLRGVVYVRERGAERERMVPSGQQFISVAGPAPLQTDIPGGAETRRPAVPVDVPEKPFREDR